MWFSSWRACQSLEQYWYVKSVYHPNGMNCFQTVGTTTDTHITPTRWTIQNCCISQASLPKVLGKCWNPWSAFHRNSHFRLGKKGTPAACYPFLWNYSSNLAASDSSRAGTISTAHEHHSPTRNGRNEVGFPFVYAYVHIWLDCWPSQFEETPTLATESPQWPFHTVLRWALALLNWFVTGL